MNDRQTMPLAKAINAGLRAAMEKNDKVLLLGEDIGTLGGVFRVTEHLKRDFGEHRVFDTPLAESGILGMAIGLAMRGYRPVCEIQFDGFVYPAFDQITSQLAKFHARTHGAVRLPVVIRIPYGGHVGAIEHHQESPETYFAHTPGLRVVSPSNPNDAYWMLQQAIESDDPVVYLEPKSRYWPKGEVDTAAPSADMGETRVAREGEHVTLIGFGAQTTMNLQAAQLAEEEGVSVEVLDLRGVAPVNYEPIFESVRKTGRAVVAQEAPGNISLASEIAARIAERCFYSLEAPVLRASAYDVPFPPARLETQYLPDVDRVLDAIDRTLDY
ncbi:alpha-ketoacid dehydrogenase subunit beta [Gulosibacter sp. 10]|uniref:alpha-ketoacid dehydrogenase subunit beta n=1 Tax=Gulosibacter sp. 10 TaxID=1255570 RepID=UPI00097F006B|nr:alpha-ketoacid dehydrogenase subunit beta [Gulosibacter sp. 10]SJM67600.1 Pyruvate dehydrogenase E1 component beta subunit [Gulosibacter sp. 10]